MNIAYKYRIYPTTEQKIFIAKTFGCCRKIWNLMLSDKIESYKSTGKFGKQTPAMYKEEYLYLKEVDSLALANVQLNLQGALKNCFDKKRKKKNGFPKYKSLKHSRKSYTTNNQNGTVAIVDNKYIKLPKTGLVKAVIHRIPEPDWKIKSATVSMDSDEQYYVSVLFEFTKEPATYIPNMDNAVGLDYSSKNLYTDDKGNIGTNHKYYKESSKRLAKEQKRLSRKKGSKKNEEKSENYIKQQKKINKIHKHISNQRKDNLHKLSSEITNQFDVICVETLNLTDIAHFLKYKNYRRSTYDNGYGILLSLLEYKAADKGKLFVKVDKAYPSTKLCSCCGYMEEKLKDISIRNWVCPKCNTSHNRDVNAAINIKNEGLRMLAVTT